MNEQYKIRPVAIEGAADADGVVLNRDGAWLGEVTLETPDGPEIVAIYSNEDGDYIPAPHSWRDLIVQKLAGA